MSELVDFDDIDSWAPLLGRALTSCVPDSVISEIANETFDWSGDIRDLLFRRVDRQILIDETIAWMQSMGIIAYHGTRVNEIELESIKSFGLIPLRREDRRMRLTRALSSHSSWAEAQTRLENVLYGSELETFIGAREGQVHLTLSRCGLIDGSGHYLTYGSEFDQSVAYQILGTAGIDLLSRDGMSVLIKVVVPGALAIDAANSFQDLLQQGEIPNMVREFIEAWACRLVDPEFQSRDRLVDCGLIFRSRIPPEWIASSEMLQD